jgi:predicted cupin superfamily sugar epimerase
MNPLLPIKTSEIIQLLGAIPHPEGGFFLETHRSGCIPMSTRGQTGYDTDTKLIVTHDRPNKHTDVRRNALTSILWIPTIKCPTLLLAVNMSDHVHYYQGGKPFQYIVYHPVTKVLDKQIVGPDLLAGHKLQFVVPGGSYKCGHMIVDYNSTPQEYTIIGEGVGPGWSSCDIHCCVENDLNDLDGTVQEALRPYLHENLHRNNEQERKEIVFDEYYDEDSKREERTEARS